MRKGKNFACVEERFAGFQVVRDLFDREEKRKFFPVNVVYQPVKRLNENIESFCTSDIRLAYRALVHHGKLRFDSMTEEQCYSCNRFFVGKASSERSVFEFLDAMRLNNQDLLNSYKATAKTHCTLEKNILYFFMSSI